MGTRKDINAIRTWKSQISATLWGLAQVRKVCASQYWNPVIYLHQGSPRNCCFAKLGRSRVILGKSPFYLMKSAENSWVCSGSKNPTVHWVYRGQFFSLFFNLQYHMDPAKRNLKIGACALSEHFWAKSVYVRHRRIRASFPRRRAPLCLQSRLYRALEAALPTGAF